ncbi:MAG: HAD family hydrolase [Micropepsaceae bacterium]
MKALLIDLDDTLYDERHYVESGFAAVAAELARSTGRPAHAIEHALLSELDRSGRGRVFDTVLAELGLAAGPVDVAMLVEHYRTHQPRLCLFPGVDETLARLRRRYRVAIVTDGLASMQRLKVAALDVERLVDAVVYCWNEKAPKPARGGFVRALGLLDVEARDAVIIGDAPHADMAAAAALRIPSIRVRGGRFKTAENSRFSMPVAEVSAFAEIEPVLGRLALKEIA